MDKIEFIAAKTSLAAKGIQAALNLFEQEATVPFIARYRREQTGGLTDEQLRQIQEQSAAFEELESRRATVLSTIEKLGKLTPALKAQIEDCSDLKNLEDIYRPYKPRRATRATKAKDAGLEKLLDFIIHDRTHSAKEQAKGFVCENYKTADDCIQGALDIWAEKIADEAWVRQSVAFTIERSGILTISLLDDRPQKTFDDYGALSLRIGQLKSYQILAIARGEKLKCLKKSFSYDEKSVEERIERHVCPDGFAYPAYLTATVEDSCERLIFPSVENEIWNSRLDKAKQESMEVFADGVKQVLMAPPLKPQAVLGFDPGYYHGCKIAVIDSSGKVLDTAVIYPTTKKASSESEARDSRTIVGLCVKHNVGCVALGNGTASRESLSFLKKTFSDNKLNIPVFIVSESGASVYSTTPTAEAEFPQYDVNLRSAVSIARRLLDPMAELVKIPPESLGVGQYQHDLDQKKLSEKLSDVVEDAVSSVGVDLNTASPQLLEHVSGLNKKSAAALVAYRNTHGKFESRSELTAVKGIGPTTYENAVGFLRIKGKEPLDDTFIHPESYGVARKLANELKLEKPSDAKEFSASATAKQKEELAKKIGTDVYTLNQILDEFAVPHRDPRGEFKAPHLLEGVTDITQLKEGMVLEGTVRNIVDFGAYVDIGVHKDGLVHISQIAERRPANPGQVLHIGQIVKVLVTKVDLERQRISLSITGAKNKELS